MGSWRPERTLAERTRRSVQSMAPGSLHGRVASASPAHVRDRQRTPIPPEAVDTVSVGGIGFAQALRVAPGPGDLTIALPHLPVEHSEHVYWNGIYQPGDQWARTGQRLLVRDQQGWVNAGDEIQVLYAYAVRPLERRPTTWAVLALAKSAAIVLDLNDTGAPYENWASTIEAVAQGTVRPGQPALFPNTWAAIETLGVGHGLDVGYGTPSLTNVSVEFRVKTTAGGTNLYLAGDRSGTSTGWKVGMGPAPVGGGSAGQIHFGVDGSGVWQGIGTSETFHDGKRHHVVCVYQHPGGSPVVQSGMKIYVDGVLRTTTNRTGPTTNVPVGATGNWQLGTLFNDTGAAGIYEGFAVYPNKALTAGDVTDLYNEALRPAA